MRRTPGPYLSAGRSRFGAELSDTAMGGRLATRKLEFLTAVEEVTPPTGMQEGPCGRASERALSADVVRSLTDKRVMNLDNWDASSRKCGRTSL